ncbi:TPA: LysR family transcriptional regulator [Klebsiella pneumoniae]|nr:LysR family transcriptional regulator [Klebsiella pneumoniae]HBQ2314527.1 LysR family transcriptional regulator [Klebsiella variicola]HBV0869460.1 LysR family transcriptional regulator [Klebsiella pneumoniae]HBY1570376.1 LysR family transcriptional regulator [Klebsiella pneumoniae]HBZ0731881.1 LysR family transcriptional regulator [Klebsiella pneumoniae]
MGRRLKFHSVSVIYFDMVRRCESIREAARRLNVASSAVNRQILKLEDDFGAPLFDRLSSGLKLTPAGELFARHVGVVLLDVERLRSELEAMEGIRSGHVELVTVETLAVDLLPTVIQQMNDRYPRVSIGVSVAGSEAIPDALVAGKADLGLAFALPKHDELQQLALGHFRLGAIVSPTHPLAIKESVKFSACADYDLILSKPDISIRHRIAPLLKSANISKRARLESSSLELAKQMVLRGTGIAFQTIFGIESQTKTGQLRMLPLIDNGGVFCDLGLYMRSGRYIPGAVDAFARLLTDEILLRERREETSLLTAR